MAENKETPDPIKDDQTPGEQDKVKSPPGSQQHESGSSSNATITNLPLKDDKAHNETEGERRFKEGMANNSGADPD